MLVLIIVPHFHFHLPLLFHFYDMTCSGSEIVFEPIPACYVQNNTTSGILSVLRIILVILELSLFSFSST
jgi:hypothetical protein